MKNEKHLNFYQNAPDLELQDTSGRSVRLSSLWQERTLVLAFTRHFGCTQCKAMLDELVSGRERIEKAGLAIAVVNQGTPEATAVFARQCRQDRQPIHVHRKSLLFSAKLHPIQHASGARRCQHV